MADAQTAGRGRLGRTWVAPPGTALLASVLLRPGLPADRLHLAGAAVSLAAADACAEVAGVAPALKWPNDLVVGERKLAGVLAEAAAPAVVVGIGVNVRWPGDHVLSPVLATSVDRVSGRQVDREALLASLLARLAGLLGDWRGVASRYRQSCATIGRLVRVELADEVFTGTAADVSDEGHLLVDVGMCLRQVATGDVVHLRPV